MKQYQGIGVSAGIAIGKVFVLHSGESFNLPKRTVGPEQISNEIARFEDALTRTRNEILQSAGNFPTRSAGKARIFLPRIS